MYPENSPSILQAALDLFWSPFRTIRQFYRELSDVDDRLLDDSIAVRVLATIAMPFRLFGGLLSLMVQNWPTSRSGVAAIAGAPAFITLAGLLTAWVLVDRLRPDSWRITSSQGYYELNASQTTDSRPEAALAYAKKLVEIAPSDAKLKYQLGVAQLRAGNPFAADDAMKSIAPDDEAGFVDAHIWRATYLVQGKTVDEFKANIDLAVNHLQTAIAADPERLNAKFQLAYLYLNFADLLEENSPERLEYLVKADDKFREIINDKIQNGIDNTIQIRTLGPSVLVRKKLEALNPEKYTIETEINRVRFSVQTLRRLAVRFNRDSLPLWLILINSATEIRQYDFAIEIANEAIKVAESPQTRTGLVKAKSLVLRKAGLNINRFDELQSYQDRFFYLCEAVRAAPTEPANYVLLLQYVGSENEKPTLKLARELGLAEPGDAVPIKPEWLYQSCTETRYAGLLNSMIGLHEFHVGNNEAAIKSWSVAQQFDPTTREFLAKLFETVLIYDEVKLDNLETMLSESLVVYPEAARIRMLRGLYYAKEKKFQAAIDDYRIVVDSQPTEILLHKRIKACYEFMGQRRAAESEQEIIDAKLLRVPPAGRATLLAQMKKMDEAFAKGGF